MNMLSVVWVMMMISIFLLLAALVRGWKVTTALYAKPGCQSRCGDMEIPYPFGIGPNCSLNQYFNVDCTNDDTDSSNGPPKPYLTISMLLDFSESYQYFQDTDHLKPRHDLYFNTSHRFEVVKNISETQIYFKSMSQIGFHCYGGYDNDPLLNSYNPLRMNFSNTPYTFAEANEITALGCDDLVIAESNQLKKNKKVTSACVSVCETKDYSARIGSCPGRGCCRTSISKSDYLHLQLLDLHSNWWPYKIFTCGIAYIGMTDDKGTPDDFPLLHLNNPKTFYSNNTLFKDKPLVLDWRINSVTCSDFTYCQENSFCHDMEDGFGGLRCMCNQGYQGDPYISPGCQDINECDHNPCVTNGTCINTQGSYYCLCPRGHYGDGQKHGSGCISVSVSHNRLTIGVGLGTGIGILLLFTCFWLYKFLKKRKNRLRRQKFFKRNGGLLLQQQLSMDDTILEKIRLFTVKELEQATDNFNECRILGQGGQGTVYKGMLPDGRIVAVKKSKLLDENQVEQFINEVVMLSQIIHRNVAKLLGCCLETQVPSLVYEFISNGTLSDRIHYEVQEFPFLWNMHLKIAVEVEEALAYLHSATSIPIYHRDIKSSNILLDEKYVAKISDFGTSRSISMDKTHLTTFVKGTFGYLDPEYFQSNHFTEKSDVYSFGVVLVELLTGQRPISSNRNEEERSLATRFLMCMLENKLETILDPQVLEQGKRKERKEVDAVAKLACRCLNLNGKKRPTMKQAAIELESIRTSKTFPKNCDSKSQGIKLGKSKSVPVFADDISSITQLDACSSSNIYTV